MDGTTLPTWMSGQQLNDRLNVWVAIGMSMAVLNLSNDASMALLRGYAYSRNLTLDQVARRVTDRNLRPEELRA
jgi:AmiR/NasT family two-component response regulator